MDISETNESFDCVKVFRCNKETMDKLQEVLGGVSLSYFLRDKCEEEIFRKTRGWTIDGSKTRRM